MSQRTVPCLAALALVFGFSWQSARAQQLAAPGGIYAAAQAARGKALYFDNCVSCHGDQLQGGEDSPPLAGPAFLAHWGKIPGALYNFINTQMPLGAPGSLGSNADADIAAYILSFNNFPAGAAEFSGDAKAPLKK